MIFFAGLCKRFHGLGTKGDIGFMRYLRTGRMDSWQDRVRMLETELGEEIYCC